MMQHAAQGWKCSLLGMGKELASSLQGGLNLKDAYREASPGVCSTHYQSSNQILYFINAFI